MVAKWTGDIFGQSLYISQMDDKSIPYLPSTPTYGVSNLSVVDVMSTDVIYLRCIEKIDIIIKVSLFVSYSSLVDPSSQVLESNTHNGFPVVANAWDRDVMMKSASASDDDSGPNINGDMHGNNNEEQRKFQGFILRKHLLALLYHLIKTQMEKERNAFLQRLKKKLTPGQEIEMEDIEEGREKEDKGKEPMDKEGKDMEQLRGEEGGGGKESDREKKDKDAHSSNSSSNSNGDKEVLGDGKKGEEVVKGGEGELGDSTPEREGHPKGDETGIWECTIAYSDFYRADYPPFSFSSFSGRQREMYIDLRPCTYLPLAFYELFFTFAHILLHQI